MSSKCHPAKPVFLRDYFLNWPVLDNTCTTVHHDRSSITGWELHRCLRVDRACNSGNLTGIATNFVAYKLKFFLLHLSLTHKELEFQHGGDHDHIVYMCPCCFGLCIYVHVTLCLSNSSTAAPSATASVTFQITPVVRGQKREASLVVTAESDQIKGIMGAADVLIV